MAKRIGKHAGISKREQALSLSDGGNITGTLSSTGAATFSAGLTISAGGLTVNGGRIIEQLTVTDNDAQHNTMAHGEITGGIVVHTSATGAGNVTTDTATNIINNCGLDANGKCIKVYYVNDGGEELTIVGGTGVTVADNGQTIAANESAILLFRRTGASAVTLYTIGA